MTNIARFIKKQMYRNKYSQFILNHKKAYQVWTDMRTRIFNVNSIDYPRYGGRGIRICPEWKSFKQFLKDMGDPPIIFGYTLTLERENNNGDYCKANCKWASAIEQANNRQKREVRIYV